MAINSVTEFFEKLCSVPNKILNEFAMSYKCKFHERFRAHFTMFEASCCCCRYLPFRLSIKRVHCDKNEIIVCKYLNALQ